MASIVVAGDTSGTVTLTAPLVAGTTTLTLPTVNGTVLTTGSTTGVNASAISTGTLARARLPAGSVLQVVQNIVTGSGDYTSSTPTLRISVSITPTASTSKFYLIYTAGDCLASVGTGVYGTSWFYRDSTQIQRFTAELGRGGQIWMVCAGNYLDTPSTSSAITYSVYHANVSNSGTFRVGDTSQPSVLTVMEIAA